MFEPREFIPMGRQYSALRVAGDSLAGEHLSDGDLVLLERREPQEGEPVVVVLDERAAALGRLFHEEKRLRLQSVNGGEWKVYPKGTAEVRGVVVGVLRRFAAKPAVAGNP